MLTIQALLLVLLPFLALFLARRFRALAFLSPVLLAYLFGIVLGLVFPVDTELSRTVSELAVPIAIPLLLFSADFVRWFRHARPAVIGFALAVVSVLLVAFVVGWLALDAFDESWKAAGMLVGVYTGGTPNLLSIGLALDVQESTYILLNAADVLIGGIYLLFLLTVAKPLLGRFLPPYRSSGPPEALHFTTSHELAGLPWSRRLLAGAAALALSLAILAVSAGIAFLLTGRLEVAIVVLGITTGGVLASFVPRIRALPNAEPLGNYFILVFCLAIGTLTDFGTLFTAGGLILLLTSAVMFGAIVLHMILCRIFRVDVDTAIITSTAAIYSPALVPPVAEALRNKEVLLSGLTTGLVGYAVANYLGLALAYLLRALG